MADELRNETKVTLSKETLTMRANVDSIRGIEGDLGRGIFRIFRDFNAFDFSFNDVVAVLFHGLKEGGSKLSVEEVAKEAVAIGIDNASAAALNFLTAAMKGQSLGKSSRPAKK